MDNETFFYIHRTRAHPPGLAGEGDRRATYGSALEQFEELIRAAAAASPGVRPLPLFYALSQAGRAIAAAGLADVWKLHGHGLSCPDLSPRSVLDLEIHIKDSSKSATPDSFHGVARATRSEIPAGVVKLGELWAALPDASTLLEEDDQSARWPEALLVVDPEMTPSVLERFDRVSVGVVSRRHPDGASIVKILCQGRLKTSPLLPVEN